MSQLNSAMDVFKLLQGTNCRKCLVPSCLAFAVEVFNGDRRLRECPYVDSNIIEQFDGQSSNWMALEQEHEQALEPLRREVASVDFSLSLERLGASLSADKLVINCLGKDFSVCPDGTIVSDCHVHAWIAEPLLNYVISCSGKTASGVWVPFRELNNGVTWGPLFADQFEKPLKQVADSHTELFENVIHIFKGRPAGSDIAADVSVALHPLPRVPILLCYHKAEDGLESTLNAFVDSTAEHNLNIESIFTLCVGLVRMFEKIADSHG